MSLHNTNTKRKLEHLGRFLQMARDYGRKNGFKGTFLVEPKPTEPTKHQYDFDAQTVIGFLRQYGLGKDFKINIEVNHATLAGHTFAHELRMSADAGMFGSIDANKGDYQNGWDTDEFPTNIYEVTEAMMEISQAGGFQNNGINFDAKTRRNIFGMLIIYFVNYFIARIGDESWLIKEGWRWMFFPGMIPSALFPNSIRGAMSIAVAAQWITNLIVSWTFPMMNDNTWLTGLFNHGFAYWIYGLMGIAAAWFVWRFVPETKGKTLEEIENLWTAKRK